MLKSVIVPQMCMGDTPTFRGSVTMRAPLIDERWAYLEECGVTSDEAAAAFENEASDKTKSVATVIKVMVKHLDKHVEAIDLEHIESGYKYTELDELKADPEAMGIILELSALLLKGFRPSKN